MNKELAGGIIAVIFIFVSIITCYLHSVFLQMIIGMFRHIPIFNTQKFSDLLPANFYIPD